MFESAVSTPTVYVTVREVLKCNFRVKYKYYEGILRYNRIIPAADIVSMTPVSQATLSSLSGIVLY